MSDIFNATKRRCIEEQRAAARAHAAANEYIEHRLPNAAWHEQLKAAKHADEAMIRLDRLIGVS